MNLIEKIQEAIKTDDCNTDKQSYMLRDRYLSSTHDVREEIDRFFIALCGFSLETLIDKEVNHE